MASSVGKVRVVPEAELTAEEKRNIKKAIKAIKPKTKEEKIKERLVGRPLTVGKYLRNAAIGSIGGIGAGSLGGLIQGDVRVRPWKVPNPVEKRRALLHPRRLAAGATVGAVYGAMIPAAQRLADIEAAKRGMY